LLTIKETTTVYFPGGAPFSTGRSLLRLRSRYFVQAGIPPGYSAAICDVKAENDPGYGTREEAIRVIKKGPNWKPAIQNGREVIYRHKQNITFRVSED